ncbi:tetratricopeptide repeat protein [Rhizobiaceae bacterium BDR2-2]|uniref:Tetratricopeptide repeat protein n=1 Tax=Ectorhizobium quercum TaxID=2965071 RepID=A0AAE3SYS8_9HYPH|nr:tetratricopeptide repeat protein [Ectorhizobium quercum]MCX8999865.1 tetratricopeptide repeat protein [Ectorhizobium quercum]
MAGAAIRGRLVAGLLLLALGPSPALAVSSAPSSDLPDISAIRAQIYGGDHEKAIAALLELTQTVQHAELYNLLGYSHRSLGRHEEAGKYYREALFLDPSHRGALEYQGELFITTGNLDGARTNLRYLQLLCGEKGCAEEEQLRKALAEAEP